MQIKQELKKSKRKSIFHWKSSLKQSCWKAFVFCWDLTFVRAAWIRIFGKSGEWAA